MAKSYLDYDGLLYLWQKIKTMFAPADQGMTAAEKTKLSGIAAGAEVNQNAFGVIRVSGTDCTATTESDTFSITAGQNMTFTVTSKGVTINGPTGITSAQSQKLAGIATGAEVNQNAFSNVKVGSTTLAADSKTDTLTITAGNNISLTPTETSDSFNIAVTGLTGNDVAYEDDITITDMIDSIQDGMAPLASPTFTGTPKAPTASAGTNDTQIATTAFVTTAVNSAIGSITGLSFEIVASLPATGVAGTIYLMSNGGSGQNIYDEYVWLASSSKFEKIGTTDVDLSNYISTSDRITNTQIDTIVAS